MGQALVMIGMCAPQLAIAMFTRWSWMSRTVAAIAMFPAAGSVIALTYGWIDRYWIPVMR